MDESKIMEINNKVEVSKCPICRFNAYEYFRHKDVADKELKLFKCINCGHGHYGHKYSKNELNSIYQAEYAPGIIVTGKQIGRASCRERV